MNTGNEIHPTLIAFARRHAYMMREGFFDGADRPDDIESKVPDLAASNLAAKAGITFSEAQDALYERLWVVFDELDACGLNSPDA